MKFASFFEILLHVLEGDESATAALLKMGGGVAHVGKGGTAKGDGLVWPRVNSCLTGGWGPQNGLGLWVLLDRDVKTDTALSARGARTDKVGHRCG